MSNPKPCGGSCSIFSGKSGALKFEDFVEVTDVEIWVSSTFEQAGKAKIIPVIRINNKMCFLLSIFKASCNYDRYSKDR
jgi:hypothetical protein